jgi:hypothetical protein
LEYRSDFANYYCNQISNSSAKIVFSFSKYWYDKLAKHCRKRGVILKETFQNYPKGYATAQNSLIFPAMEKVVDRFFSFGMIKDFYVYSQAQAAVKKPKVFSVKDLNFGFMVWLVACACSIFAFIAEILCKVLSEIIGCILFFKMLKVRLNKIN